MTTRITSPKTVALIALVPILMASAHSRAQAQVPGGERIPHQHALATWSPSGLYGITTRDETDPLPFLSVFSCRVPDTSPIGWAISSSVPKQATLLGTSCPTTAAGGLFGLGPGLFDASANLSRQEESDRPAAFGLFLPQRIFTRAGSASVAAEPLLQSRRESKLMTSSARQENDQEFLRRYTDSAGNLRPDLWLKGILQFQQMKTTSGLVGVQWKQIGPSPLKVISPNGADGKGPDSGEVTDIAIDPRGSTDQTIYIAANDGGIWKTTDGGSTWTPKTDFMPSLSMGAVALDPGNPSIVYAGTGNFFNNGFFKGVGIYKSLDAGDTWTILGANLFTGAAINRIVLPAPDVLLIASSNGLYRSVDGGLTFGGTPPLFNDGNPIPIGGTFITNFITDLKLDTASPSTVYVAVAGSGSTGGGIFKSTNGGETFPFPSFFTSANGGTADAYFIAFAQSTNPDNRTMYTNVSRLRPNCQDEEILKSVDGGSSWQTIPSDSLGVQCFYDQTVGVDPQDADRAYFGNRDLFMVTDGGASGITSSNRMDCEVHADQHALVFSPMSHVSGPPRTRIYNGSDGGIATTIDADVHIGLPCPSADHDGNGHWTPLNGSDNCFGPDSAIATVLFRHIDIGRGGAANNEYTYGTAQDLGVSSHRPTCPGTPWYEGIGGDGFAVAVDPLDPTHAIASSDQGFCVSSPDGEFSPSSGGFPPPPSIPGLLYFDPNGGNTALGGNARAYGAVNTSANDLWLSTDNADTFAFMHRFCFGIGACASQAGPGLSAINMIKLDSNTIWVGLGDGTVASTGNALANLAAVWTSHVVTGAPNMRVSGIAIDPSDTARVVVVYPDGVSGSSTQKAFMTSDNGATWTDIGGSSPTPSENLPNVPLNAVVIDPNTNPHSIIVASDAGVMRTADFGATWVVLGEKLPTVQCTDLAMDSSRSPSLLRVGTYGRSAFELLMGSLAGVSPAHLWIGLKNSDDQGTQFDLKAELLVNGTPVASGLQRCVTGVTRNPASAREVIASFGSFPAESVASGDVLALRVSTRIGTNPDDTKCAGPGGSHKSAVGLRLYYDSASRPSRFDATITPNPNADLYLRSDGKPCPNGDGQSTGVTTRTLDTAVPAAASAKCKDSGIVNFAGGNPFSLIGTWSLAPLP